MSPIELSGAARLKAPVKLLLWTSEDPASARIAAALREAGAFRDGGDGHHTEVDVHHGAVLARVDGSLLEADFAERKFEAPGGARFERALFLSKHSASSGQTAFTVHPIGNLGREAKLGGAPRTLAPPDPAMATSLLRALWREARPLKVGATFEATHHGPRMEIPSLFVEVGSGPRDWEEEGYAAAVARAVVTGYLEQRGEAEGRVALGLGGGHYHPKHSDRAREEGLPFGHLVPAYALEGADEATLRSAAEQSRATTVAVDARTEPAQVEKAATFLESIGLARVTLGP